LERKRMGRSLTEESFNFLIRVRERWKEKGRRRRGRETGRKGEEGGRERGYLFLFIIAPHPQDVLLNAVHGLTCFANVNYSMQC
jgi:hypothetical protein